MKWVRRILVALVALPLLAVVGLLLAGQREGAGRNTERLAIARPPAEVYRHLVSPDLLRRWTGLAEVEVLGAAKVESGSRLRLVSEVRGQRTSMEAEVLAAEPARRLTLAVRTAAGAPVGFTQRVEYRLEERGGDTRLSVTSDTRYENAVARLLEPVITRAVQKQLEATLERLRVEVEAQPVPR
jgi:uncharacterized protein YndB with AHSA1/START domain